MINNEHYSPAGGLDLSTFVQNGDLVGAHHLIHYLWALEVVGDLKPVKNLLDVACGAGYGSHLLAQRYPDIHVVGADYDPAAVEAARRTYSLPNLEYRCGDVTRWEETIGSQVFGCIMSFETIEHVSHRELMMQYLVDHLDPDGVLLLSTPCGWLTPNLKPEWEYHRIEYSAGTLYDFLSRYFETILRPDNFTLPHVQVFDQLLSKMEYLLWMNPVLCKNPIRIPNPYSHSEIPKILRYMRVRRNFSVLRAEGLIFWLRQKLTAIRRRMS